MSKLEFVSSEKFPDDEYTKELVYLCLEGKYRVAYVRKKAKTGGLFWSAASVGVTKNGTKEYFPAFLQDSNFLERDIKDFLEKRSWDKGPYAQNMSVQTQAPAYEAPRSMSEVAEQSELPF